MGLMSGGPLMGVRTGVQRDLPDSGGVLHAVKTCGGIFGLEYEEPQSDHKSQAYHLCSC